MQRILIKGYIAKVFCATFDQEIAKKYATGIVLQITLPKLASESTEMPTSVTCLTGRLQKRIPQ